MNKIEILRKRIDEIDRKLAQLLLQRFETTGMIGEIKKKSKNSILDKKREAKVINNVKKSSRNSKDVVTIYKKILEVSRKSQK